jgi:D-tyrosyl-tRNA(Tyr) deacylase
VNKVNRVVEYKTVRVRVKAETRHEYETMYTYKQYSLKIFTSRHSSAFVRLLVVAASLPLEDVMDYANKSAS